MTTTETANSSLRSELTTVIRHRPFRPFAVVTQDGKKYRVTREFQAATTDTHFAMITKDDRMIWIKLADVTSIQPLPMRRGRGGRGKSR